jgi:hypothetical protein
MRINRAIFAIVVAAFASGAAPALASHTKTQAPAEPTPPTSSACSAMQPMPDGTWQRQPCQEMGSPSPAPRTSAARSTGQQTR